MKYRKKPIEVEAFRYGIKPYPDEFYEMLLTEKNIMIVRPQKTEEYMMIDTPEGVMRANRGDYIIRGIAGEVYPCKADIFEMIYEKVEDRCDE